MRAYGIRQPSARRLDAMAPIPFLSHRRDDSQVTLHEEAAAYLSTLTTPIALILVAGPARSGKSFLANQLIGRMDGFEVRPGAYACTRGISLWPYPQYVDIGDRRTALLMLDCQAERDEETDRLFGAAAALSAAIIYSTMGSIDEAQLELLARLFSDASEAPPRSPEMSCVLPPSIATPDAPTHSHAPLFVWALRDSPLPPRDAHGKALSPSHYLERALGAAAISIDTRGQAHSRYTVSLGGGRAGALLRKLLPRRACVALPRPVADDKLLPQLHRLPPSTLRPKWRHGITELRSRLIDGISSAGGAYLP